MGVVESRTCRVCGDQMIVHAANVFKDLKPDDLVRCPNNGYGFWSRWGDAEPERFEELEKDDE